MLSNETKAIGANISIECKSLTTDHAEHAV